MQNPIDILRPPARRASIIFVLFVLALLPACDFTTSRPPIVTRPANHSPALQIPPSDDQVPEQQVPPPTATFLPTPILLPTASPTPAATATPTPLPAIRFAVIGDFGLAGQPETDVANLVKSWNPDFILTTGDNNYPDGSRETIDENIGRDYHEFIAPYQGAYGPGAEVNRFFPTLGNHDWHAEGAQPYLDYFTLPGNERYYDFIQGPVHFFALNADSREPDGVSSISIQANWLKERLAASTSSWQVVYMHQAPYTSGIHGPTDWMQWPFAEWGADVTFAGHDHTYERLQIDGIPYFVNGVGGGPIYDFEDIQETSQFRFNDDYGAMLVIADEQQMTFQFITRAGALIDSYQLQK